jgi:CubicO group peptidase (beta-lactamase class C family)
MLHKVERHGRVALIRALLVVVALLTLGLVLLAREAGAQAPADAWKTRLDSAILAQMAASNTPGAQVAVVYRGEVVYAKAYGVADIETGRAVSNATLFRIGSVTKMMTGALAAELAEQGKLDLTAPISRYVPSLEGKRVGTVTTHQLLTHSAGWRDNAVAYGRMGEGALGEVMREVSDTLFMTEPGRVVSYSNPGYSMAGYVIERAGGERYGALMDRMILRPTGMPHATFRPLEAMTRDFSQGHEGPPNGRPQLVRPFTENTAQWAAGFLLASATDVARFASLLMDGGMIDGKRVISENAARRVVTGDPSIPGDSTARYAYGVMTARQDGRVVWQHGGSINGFDAMVTMLPTERFAMVIVDNRSGAGFSGLTRIAASAVAGIQIPTPPAAPEERMPTAAEREQLVGRYSLGPAVSLEIAASGDTLSFRQGGAALGVRMLGTDRIRLKTPGTLPPVVLELVRDANGRVTYLHQGLRAIPRVETPR